MAGVRYTKWSDANPQNELASQRDGYGDEGGLFPGSDITQEQVKFGVAMKREQRRLGRLLDCCDVLRVAKQLGYENH